MTENILYLLCCLGLAGMWGYKIYEGYKKKDKFTKIYSSGVCLIFLAMMIIKMLQIVGILN